MDDEDLEYNGFNFDHATDRYLKDKAAEQCTRIVGTFGGGRQRRYICNVCGCLVDTESATSRQTVHAVRAITAHVRMHREELLAATKLPGAYEWVRELPSKLWPLVHLAARSIAARLVVTDLLEERGWYTQAAMWREDKIDHNLVTVLARQGSIV